MRSARYSWSWLFYLSLAALFLGLLSAAVAGCRAKAPSPGSTPSPAIDHSITLTWSQSFGNNQPCSATITASCYTGFDEGYVDLTGADVQLHTDDTTVCTITSGNGACKSTFNGVLPIGAVVFYVKSMFKDQSGAAVESKAATSAAVSVSGDSPTNIVATINN